jgi:hypothetical protein
MITITDFKIPVLILTILFYIKINHFINQL